MQERLNEKERKKQYQDYLQWQMREKERAKNIQTQQKNLDREEVQRTMHVMKQT